MKVPKTRKIDKDILLEALVTFLRNKETSNRERHEVWSILSALRGPDDNNSVLKEATTAVIRRHLLGELADNYGDSFIDSPDSVKIRISATRSHFIDHARLAFAALDLKWGKLNEKSRFKKGGRHSKK
jgi:hypothetical protein